MNRLESRIKKLEVKTGANNQEVNIYSLMPHLEEVRVRLRQEIERMKALNRERGIDTTIEDKRAEHLVTGLRNLSLQMQAERGIHTHENR